MHAPALGPLVAFAGGTAAALFGFGAPPLVGWLAGWAGASLWLLALASRGPARGTHARRMALLGCVALWGASLTSSASERALRPPVRSALDAHMPGFTLDDPWSAPQPEPIVARVVVESDAVRRNDSVALRVVVRAIRHADTWMPTGGTVALTVGGAATDRDVDAWHRGSALELPIAFRRPARFFNAGVPDAERVRALAGTALVGTVKSPLLVEIIAQGSWPARAGAAMRRRVRHAVSRALGDDHEISAAVVRAVLIGDDAALPLDLRERWQAAGTYHVLAISGGNIVVVVLIALGCARTCGRGPRGCAAVALVTVAAFAVVVVSGASVRRAVWMAVLHLIARLADHRTSAWQALGVATMGLLVVDPLSARDPGFLLTCGATAALIACPQGAVRAAGPAPARWVATGVVASLAVEAVVLPVGLVFFNQVSLAGLGLNLLVVPVMAAVQGLGLAIVASDAAGVSPQWLGWLARVLITGLDGAVLAVSDIRWLAWRAPAPSAWIVGAYYTGLVVWRCFPRRDLRWLAAFTTCTLAVTMAHGVLRPSPGPGHPDLRVTMLDVGQGDAVLVEADGHRLLVDTGGRPFGDATDIGRRVVVPSLWARGVRSLDALLVTHGDPDHVGGAGPVLDALRVGMLWQGVPVPGHEPTEWLAARAAAAGTPAMWLRAGAEWSWGSARVRVLHPPAPDWERRRVRNDDSVVVELTDGDVAVLLTGDISADVEREILPRLRPARVRVLKVAHHGSRTSTSRALIEAWQPHVALVSCGRGNTFGHPAGVVLDRLRAAGTAVFRTDQEGQVTVRSNGRAVWVDSYRGRAVWLR